MTSRALGFGWVGAALLMGCSHASTPSASCTDENLVGGVCAGVPAEPLCGGDVCTTGSCNAVVDFAGAASAKSGDCVALASGDYPAIVLPDGVSLFGPSADAVRVKSITAGGNMRVAGLTVAGGGIVLKAGATANVDGVRVQMDPADKTAGITVGAGASLTLSRSEISGAGTYGIGALGASAVAMSKTVVRDGAGPAVWASCGSKSCACGAPPVQVTIADSKIDKNALVGVALVNAKASLSNVAITNTKVGPDFKAGGGMSISQCSVVTGTSVQIVGSTDFGLLIDDSTATLDTFHIEGNLRGMWVQNVGKSQPSGAVSFTSSDLLGNSGVGFGLAAASKNVTLSSVSIDDTKQVQLPVLVDGQASMNAVGDGLNWSGASQLKVDGLKLSRSTRRSVLIDGDVASGSALANVTLSMGDDATGIVQQGVGAMPVSPTTTNSPPIATLSDHKYSVPTVIAPPDI